MNKHIKAKLMGFLYNSARRLSLLDDVHSQCDAAIAERDSLSKQLHQITDSLVKNSGVFNREDFRTLNPMYGAGYESSTSLSEKYRTCGEAEYFSCIYLQGSVNIELDVLGICTCPHLGNRGCVRIGRFNGDTFPFDLLMTARMALTRDINAGIDTPCTGCKMLQKKKWDNAIYPVKFITINDWVECNLRCEYCYTLRNNSSILVGEKRTHNLSKLVADMFSNRYIDPNCLVTWGGGEVTVYKDFEKVSTMFADHGIRQNVNTNAVLFSDVIERGLREKTMSVLVSVDAGTRDVYSKVKGLDAFNSVWQNISKYNRAGEVVVKYIIYNNNSSIDDVNNFVNLCKLHNIESIALSPEINQDTNKLFTDETLYGVATLIHEAEIANLKINYSYPFYQHAQEKIDKYLEAMNEFNKEDTKTG